MRVFALNNLALLPRIFYRQRQLLRDFSRQVFAFRLGECIPYTYLSVYLNVDI